MLAEQVGRCGASGIPRLSTVALPGVWYKGKFLGLPTWFFGKELEICT